MENLLRDAWAALDPADVWIYLEERIGGPGQRDGDPNVLHIPSARDKCRVSIAYKGSKIVAIERGPAFDGAEWTSICAEIETSSLQGLQKIGRDVSFSSFRVEGWWRGARSGVQILPPPDDAPRPPGEGGDHPFILEFPVHEASLWRVTNHRRMREHQRLTLLLNLLLAGTTKFLPSRQRRFWASLQSDDEQKIKWVQEFYFADLGEAVITGPSSPRGKSLEEVESEKYYTDVGHDGRGLSVPDDLDESIVRYQNLSPIQRAKFDRAAYWMSMASRQWEDSMSASFTSLVSSAEALTGNFIQHHVYCDECQTSRSHDVPGATKRFRDFFEEYAPNTGLRDRRGKMYQMRSKIVHGGDLMQLDQGRAFGWIPPWWNERENHEELWNLTRIAARNWLKSPPVE